VLLFTVDKGRGSVFLPEIVGKIWPQGRRRHCSRHPVDTDQCFRLSRLGHVFPRRIFRPIRNNFPRPDGRPTADGVYIIYIYNMYFLFQPPPQCTVFSPTSFLPTPPQYNKYDRCRANISNILYYVRGISEHIAMYPMYRIFVPIWCTIFFILTHF